MGDVQGMSLISKERTIRFAKVVGFAKMHASKQLCLCKLCLGMRKSADGGVCWVAQRRSESSPIPSQALAITRGSVS